MRNTLPAKAGRLTKRSSVEKFFRIFGIIAVIVLIIAAIIASMNNGPSNAEKVWDERTTIGDLEAKNYFIIYSDLVCPYCIAFENAIVEHEDDFQKYIEENDILVEVRLSDFLYEYGESNPINSLYSAEAVYCARDEGKFWDYYNLAVTTVWDDYFSGSGKSGVGKMSSLGKDYWIDIGQGAGLGEDFASCVKDDTTKDEIVANSEKTAKLTHGMPYFKFNSFTSSGFDLSWGYDQVLQYFQAGLDS